MKLHIVLLLVAVVGCAYATPINAGVENEKLELTPKEDQNEDLKTEASSAYGRRYSDWGGYPSASGYSGYGVTGQGFLDDKYNNYNSYSGGYGGGYNGGYDNMYGYNGYSSYPGYSGYSGNAGYGYNDYSGYKRYGGYSSSNGGYGGYGGNGGLTSYYGYNSPYNQGAYHLGYGYYNKSPGNIYNSGVTPSLVTGYRGYSRR